MPTPKRELLLHIVPVSQKSDSPSRMPHTMVYTPAPHTHHTSTLFYEIPPTELIDVDDIALHSARTVGEQLDWRIGSTYKATI